MKRATGRNSPAESAQAKTSAIMAAARRKTLPAPPRDHVRNSPIAQKKAGEVREDGRKVTPRSSPDAQKLMQRTKETKPLLITGKNTTEDATEEKEVTRRRIVKQTRTGAPRAQAQSMIFTNKKPAVLLKGGASAASKRHTTVVDQDQNRMSQLPSSVSSNSSRDKPTVARKPRWLKEKNAKETTENDKAQANHSAVMDRVADGKIKDEQDVKTQLQNANLALMHKFQFRPVNLEWQRDKCTEMKLKLTKSYNLEPRTLLGTPVNVLDIEMDENCLFRCLSVALTGDETSHEVVRRQVVDHMEDVPRLDQYLPEGVYTVSDYARLARMRQSGEWGTVVEIYAAAYLFRTDIYVYTLKSAWSRHGLSDLGPGLRSDARVIFLQNTEGMHYDFVLDVK